MKNMLKTTAVTGMLSAMVLSSGCVQQPYTIGGSVSGLVGNLALNNYGNSLLVSQDGNFNFFQPVGTGTNYNVTIVQQPSTQVCSIANGRGIISTASASDITITCIDKDLTKTWALNDTGVVLCGDHVDDAVPGGPAQNTLDCAATGSGSSVAGIDGDGDSVPPGQDAHYGRDASHNDPSDGHAGFSFTKLDNDGQSLPASAYSWNCVQDNVTGLVWEVKTNNRGLHGKEWVYTRYNSSGINDGGNAGFADPGYGVNTPGSDLCANISRCDTEKYISDVNAVGLCGASDWRLPSREELHSLLNLDRINPAIDTDYFPNTMAWSPLYYHEHRAYLSSSASPNSAAGWGVIWGMHSWGVDFYTGSSFQMLTGGRITGDWADEGNLIGGEAGYVRLVRSIR